MACGSLRIAFGELGLHAPRADERDLHARARDFAGQHTTERDVSGFRRCIDRAGGQVCSALAGAEREQRRDIDDPARPLVEQTREDGAREQERRRGIQGPQLAHSFRRDLGERSVPAGAGVVHEYVHIASGKTIGDRLDPFDLRQVGDQRFCR